jgi:hypothetical protein
MQGSGFKVQGTEFWIRGYFHHSGVMIHGSEDSRFRVDDLAYRVQAFLPA